MIKFCASHRTDKHVQYSTSGPFKEGYNARQRERTQTVLGNNIFLFQEKFAEFHVLDAVLGLLCLINSLQLEKLNQQIKANAGTETQTVILESEAELLGGSETGRPTDEGFITRVVSSPSENVSVGAEEGKFELYTICFILSTEELGIMLKSINFMGGKLCDLSSSLVLT